MSACLHKVIVIAFLLASLCLLIISIVIIIYSTSIIPHHPSYCPNYNLSSTSTSIMN